MLDQLCITKRPPGPSWCIAWTATPPACCWWRARRRRRRAFRARWPAATPPKSIGRWSRACPSRSTASIKAALAKEGARGKGERMAVSEDDDAKFALTEYAVMGTGGTGIRLGGGAARHRAHPPDPRASGQPGHAHRGRFQIWRRGCARARAPSPTSCICMPARSISPAPMAGGCRSPRRLSPHMVKSWAAAGLRSRRQARSFSAEEPKKKTMKRFTKTSRWAETRRRLSSFLLDGKPVQTPGRNTLVLPNRSAGRSHGRGMARAGRGDRRHRHAADPAGQHGGGWRARQRARK